MHPKRAMLEYLIENTPEDFKGGVPVQIMFNSMPQRGIGGVLRRGPVEGIYALIAPAVVASNQVEAQRQMLAAARDLSRVDTMATIYFVPEEDVHTIEVPNLEAGQRRVELVEPNDVPPNLRRV